MDGIAAASVQNAAGGLQQAAQIDLLKRANDVGKDSAARLLASAQAPAPAAAANRPGIGQLIDRFA